MSHPPRWGVSSLDYHTHAVEEDAEHTDAVYVARCGQMLFRSAVLYDEPPPGGSMCPTCLRWTRADPDAHPGDEGLDESCPGCGATTEVRRSTCAGDAIRAWSCAACGMAWAITVVNRHLRTAHLADVVAEVERFATAILHLVGGPAGTARPLTAEPGAAPPSPRTAGSSWSRWPRNTGAAPRLRKRGQVLGRGTTR